MDYFFYGGKCMKNIKLNKYEYFVALLGKVYLQLFMPKNNVGVHLYTPTNIL